MSPEDVVDVAIAGLMKAEFVTIPSLPERADWEAFQHARDVLQLWHGVRSYDEGSYPG
jgi:uncharacterized protein